MEIPQYVKSVMNKLSEKGFESYIVGGCVRDSLLGKIPKDYDVCTNALPENLMEIFGTDETFSAIPTGIKHGTVTVLSEKKTVEVTTYRCDGEYKDHRRPENVSFGCSLEEDLKRRDFTVNALCYNEKTGLVDLFDGKKDLENKVIRCVGNPAKRFNEDALRILRGLRFASTTGFEIEENTAKAMKEFSCLLKDISAERIFSELKKILVGKNAGEILLEYREIFGIIIPELIKTFDFPQKCPHHCYDVYTHICKSVENIPPREDLRLTMLFHDIEKPKMAKTDEKGVMHFKLHPGESAVTARKILKRLKCDNKTLEKVTSLIACHDDRMENSRNSTLKRFIGTHGEEFFYDYLLVRNADTLAQSDYKREEKLSALENLRQRGEKIIAEKNCVNLKELSVKGNDLIEAGFKGSKIGEGLKMGLDAVIEEKIPNEKQAVLEYIKEHTKI